MHRKVALVQESTGRIIGLAMMSGPYPLRTDNCPDEVPQHSDYEINGGKFPGLNKDNVGTVGFPQARVLAEQQTLNE